MARDMPLISHLNADWNRDCGAKQQLAGLGQARMCNAEPVISISPDQGDCPG